MHKIERMIKLQERLTDRVHNELAEILVNIDPRLIEGSLGYHNSKNFDKIEDEGGRYIYFYWEETWSYGGHDSGCFYVLKEILFNPEIRDKALEEKISKEEAIKLQKNEAAKLLQIENDRKKLAELLQKQANGEI